jgi:uncharacterized SAM-binding protein YcdF (DUF218 family)
MGTAKKGAKKAPTTKKKTSAKKPVKKATPKVTGWKSFFRRRTIAEKKVLWKSGKPLAVLRWVAMIPLAFFAYVFKFVMAGYSFTALVCCALIGILLFYSCAHLLEGHFPKPVTIVRRIFTVCLCIGLLVVGITECLIIKASFGDPREKCEYMVVLGAKVRADGPSVSLMDRINAAYAYMTEHPDVIAVVSGGQGPDEHMSEAQCMYDHLVARGIDPERVWMEEQATNTLENIRFSLDLIEEQTGTRPNEIGLVSSEYHLYRAGLFARKENVISYGIPARTSWVALRVNYFLREIIAVWYYTILGG